MRRAAIASVVLAVVTGCSSEPDAPVTFSINGSVHAAPELTQKLGTQCESEGSTIRLREGTPVTISDESGTTVGSGFLRVGFLQSDGGCRFGFSPTVPEGPKFYSVQIATGEPVTFAADEAREEIELGMS